MKENKIDRFYINKVSDSTEHVHNHENDHRHSHQSTKLVVNRLARAIGHLEKVKQMVESGNDCNDVLIQLSAVIAALNNTGKVILKDHLENCIVDAIELGNHTAIGDLVKAINQFVK